MFSICLLLILTFGQQEPPKQPTHQDLMRAIQELQREAEETRKEVKLLRISRDHRQAQREVQQKAAEAERERQRVSRLAKKNTTRLKAAEEKLKIAQEKLEITHRDAVMAQNIELRLAAFDKGVMPQNESEEHKLLAAMVIERARLKEKIRKNNNSKRCRWFRIGCIK